MSAMNGVLVGHERVAEALRTGADFFAAELEKELVEKYTAEFKGRMAAKLATAKMYVEVKQVNPVTLRGELTIAVVV